MARITNIFGTGIVGKLGNTVFYQYKGKNCMRSLPVRNNNNWTPKQQQNNRRFAAMVHFSQLFKYEVIPQIWNQASKSLNGPQLFIRTNKQAFDAEGQLTDPALVQVSTGKLHLPLGIRLSQQAEDPRLVDVRWLPDFGGGDMAQWDELLVIAHGQGAYSPIQATGIRRGTNAGRFELPEMKGTITHLYLFFCSLDKRQYSESTCMEL